MALHETRLQLPRNDGRTAVDMIIAVVGGRSFNDKAFMKTVMQNFCKKGDTVISGGAIGADSFACDLSRELGLEFMAFLPETPGRDGLLARNRSIARACEIMLAFPTKESRGTWHTINNAIALKRRVIVFYAGDIMCDKCNSVHMAQRMGTTTVPCNCECHLKASKLKKY